MTCTPEERARIERVVQEAADRAYAARVQRAFAARWNEGRFMEMAAEVERSEALDDRAWERLCASCRGATREEFLAFARALRCEPRWLAVGSGPMAAREGEEDGEEGRS